MRLAERIARQVEAGLLALDMPAEKSGTQLSKDQEYANGNGFEVCPTEGQKPFPVSTKPTNAKLLPGFVSRKTQDAE